MQFKANSLPSWHGPGSVGACPWVIRQGFCWINDGTIRAELFSVSNRFNSVEKLHFAEKHTYNVIHSNTRIPVQNYRFLFLTATPEVILPNLALEMTWIPFLGGYVVFL